MVTCAQASALQISIMQYSAGCQYLPTALLMQCLLFLFCLAKADQGAQSGNSITAIFFCILLIPQYEAEGASVAMVLAALTVWCITPIFMPADIFVKFRFSVLVKSVLFSLVSAILAS